MIPMTNVKNDFHNDKK